MERLREASRGVRVAGSRGVWKEECAFSFATAESESSGLFLNVGSLQAFAMDWVALDHQRTGNEVYMVVKHFVKQQDKSANKKAKVELSLSEEDKVEGEVVKEYGFVVFPELDEVFPYPNEALPQELIRFAESIIETQDAGSKTNVQAWSAGEEPRPVSKFADKLVQLPDAPKISPDPKTWKCAVNGQQDNLWLNLSTGYIGSGRRNWDGSGGCGAALQHFEETGSKYPLCVKLGTISAEGTADVYSYDPSEDCMVQDPLIEKHLLHFGINMAALKKTDKTMLEMEIDLNENITLSQVLESGEQLEESYGPFRVGLYNLGNSCYCNSVYQCLLHLDVFRERFCMSSSDQYDLFAKAPSEPQRDLQTQLVKLASAFAQPQHLFQREAGQIAVSPKMLINTVGKGHVDFGTREQQDAKEYLIFLLEKISRMDHALQIRNSVASAFAFQTQERLVCTQSNMVQYNDNESNVLMLAIPEDHTTRQQLSLDDCFRTTLLKQSEILGYTSPATQKAGIALTQVSMKSFPKILCVQLQRYIVAPDWTPQKIQAKISVPLDIDLEEFRAKPRLPDEVLLPQGPLVDKAMAEQLVDMGFSESQATNALHKVRNAGVEQAMQYILEHPDEQPEGSEGLQQHDPESVSMLASMGFSEQQAKKALEKCAGNVERAADYLFSHAAELEEQPTQYDDGPAKYELMSFISHIGKQTSGGHYVCHVRHGNQWLLFNDRKVAVSKTPPLDLGFIYFFQRKDTL